jgi:MFS family permease
MCSFSVRFAVLHLGENALGVVSGIITSSFSFGEVCGPAIGGFLMQKFGFQLGTVVYASIILAVAIALLIFLLTSGPYEGWSLEEEDPERVLAEPLLDPRQSIYIHPDR